MLAFVMLVTGVFGVFPDLLKAVTFLLCWSKKVNKRLVLYIYNNIFLFAFLYYVALVLRLPDDC